MKPTLGRIVHYCYAPEKWCVALVVSEDRETTDDVAAELEVHFPLGVGATVREYFSHDAFTVGHHVLYARRGTEPGCWRWPPRDEPAAKPLPPVETWVPGEHAGAPIDPAKVGSMLGERPVHANDILDYLDRVRLTHLESSMQQAALRGYSDISSLQHQYVAEKLNQYVAEKLKSILEHFGRTVT